GLPAAGCGGDAAQPRLRRGGGAARLRPRCERGGGRRPRGLPRRVRRGGGAGRCRGGHGRRGGAAGRLRGGQGRLRGAVRGAEPTGLAADPAGGARPAQRTRRGGGVSGLSAETGLVVGIGAREPGRNGALTARTATRTPSTSSSWSPAGPAQLRVVIAAPTCSARRRIPPAA